MKSPHPLRRLARLCVALAAAGCAATALAQAPAWPGKPVKLLVGSPPGGPSDITGRLFAEHLARKLGQPVVVENRPGAGNNLAAGAVAKAEPDGTTLVLSPDTVLTVNPLVYGNRVFNAKTDLVNVSIIASFSQMLVCNPSLGVKTVPELVAKAKGGKLSYASGGPGVPGHLAAELLLEAIGGTMQHVPYRGPAPATQAVLAGEVHCGFLATPTVLPHVQAGKLNALAVSSATPSVLAPEVPTLARALKQPRLDATFRLVLQTTKGTPPAVLAQLERAAAEIMKTTEVRARMQVADLVPLGLSSAESQKVLDAEIVRWEPLVKRLDLRAN